MKCSSTHCRCFSANGSCESHSLIGKCITISLPISHGCSPRRQIYGEIVKVSCPAVDRWVNGFNHKGILG
jgi:hypothetical protein